MQAVGCCLRHLQGVVQLAASQEAGVGGDGGAVASSTPEDSDRDVRALESRRAQRASHGTVRDPDAHSTFNGCRFSPFECLDLANGPSAYERSKAEEARGENRAKFGRSLESYAVCYCRGTGGQRELDRNGNRENEVNLGQGEMPYRLIPAN